MYADIDGLRETTWAEKTNNMERRELDILNEIRTKLAVCLEDAFFERAKKGDKFDLFELGEPDIIIMTRGIKRETARKIAEAGKNSFENHW